MMIRLFLLAVCLLSPSLAAGQRCGGLFRLDLLDRGDTVRFRIDSAAYIPAGGIYYRLTSTDGRFSVIGEENGVGPDGICYAGFRVWSIPTMELWTHCGGDFTLTLLRNVSGCRDSMILRITNACDLSLGLAMEYRPGMFDVLGCDTARFRYRLRDSDQFWLLHLPSLQLPEAYRVGYFDLPAVVTRVDAMPEMKGCEEGERGNRRHRIAVRPVDERGNILPGADVRVRGIPSPRPVPDFRGPLEQLLNPMPRPRIEATDPVRFTDSTQSVQRLPDYWTKLHYSPEAEAYVLDLPDESLRPDLVELWVCAPGYVRIGPQPLSWTGRLIFTDSLSMTYARLYPGSGLNLLPSGGSYVRYDLFSCIIIVPGREFDAGLRRTLVSLPDVRSVESTPEGLLLHLGRDLLPFDDPLLRRLHTATGTEFAAPAIRRDEEFSGASFSGAPFLPLPRSFLVESSDVTPQQIDSMASVWNVEAIAHGGGIWEIRGRPGTGSGISLIACEFNVSSLFREKASMMITPHGAEEEDH